MKNSVTFREKIGYGFGDMASSMFWKIFGMYLLFFYTKVFGITPAAAGTMFLVTRIWDSLNDPIMGLLADRTRSRWGRYRPYLLWGAFPFAAVGVLTFWTPDFGMTGKLAWAYITYTAMMMVYTMVNVPYASLLGVMTPDTKIRNTFSSYRMFFAYGGQSGDLHAVAAAGGFLCRTARRRRYRPVERERRGERRGHIGDAGGVDLRRGRYRSDLRPAFLALLPLDARTDSGRRRAAGGGIGRPRPEKPGPQRSVVDSSGRRSGGAAVQLDPRRGSDFLFHGLCSERL